jgi:RNA polymerase sigma-70 factor (ECF subfamily)
MNMNPVQLAADALGAASPLSDSEVAERVTGGERGLFEILMRRHNQRIYRVVRAVLRDEQDVEDVMQQAYINAFVHLHQFERRSQFSTWLTRIALNEAFARRKKSQAAADDGAIYDVQSGELMNSIPSPWPDPERQAYAGELTRALEQAVDALPETYRVVFMLRDVEGLSTLETAEGLGLGDEAVKTRLHRARAMVRRAITARLGERVPEAFQFHAPRCDRVVAAVLAHISAT